MAEACKVLGKIVLKLLHSLKQNDNTEEIVKEANEKLEELASLADSISASLLGEKAETLADMLESEMSAMDKAIEEAANRIQVKIYFLCICSIFSLLCHYYHFYVIIITYMSLLSLIFHYYHFYIIIIIYMSLLSLLCRSCHLSH